MSAANQKIRDFTGTQERVQYIDVASAMFDAHGNVEDGLFAEDGLHPAPKCYALWTSIIKPVLLQRFGSLKTVQQTIKIGPNSPKRCGHRGLLRASSRSHAERRSVFPKKRY